MKSHSDETNESSPAVDEWRGLGDLLSLATERLTAPVEGMHRAIADRWFGLAGPRAARSRRAYQAVTGTIYGSVRVTGALLGTAVGLGAAAAGVRNGLPPLWRSSFGRGIQATANAVWGDELDRRQSHLRIELGLRDAEGDPINPDPVDLARAFPEPTGRLVVLLHGLGETEHCWLTPTVDGEAAFGLGDVLAADSFTPLLVRYNTGRHISDNGLALATLLESVEHNWPVPVEEFVLVGNSMGGLVARSSLPVGQAAGARWPNSVRHVVALGAPHLGAPLEKGANLISLGMRVSPESRPLSDFLDQRSSGIKDLRFGAIQEVDWHEANPDALLSDLASEVPLPEGVEQHFIAGVITADPAHPVGVLVGDLIVRVGSATGRGPRRHVEATDVRVLGGRRHFDLAQDPAVHQQIRDWLVKSAGDSPG